MIKAAFGWVADLAGGIWFKVALGAIAVAVVSGVGWYITHLHNRIMTAETRATVAEGALARTNKAFDDYKAGTEDTLEVLRKRSATRVETAVRTVTIKEKVDAAPKDPVCPIDPLLAVFGELRRSTAPGGTPDRVPRNP